MAGAAWPIFSHRTDRPTQQTRSCHPSLSLSFRKRPSRTPAGTWAHQTESPPGLDVDSRGPLALGDLIASSLLLYKQIGWPVDQPV